MKFPASRALRLLTATALLFSWFVATNHCLLGLMQTRGAAEEHQHCAGHPPASGGEKNGNDAQPCCQALKASPPQQETNAAPNDAGLTALYVYIVCASVLSGNLEACGLQVTGDTGPPGALTFAEIVLQRSLQSHAPPSLSLI